MLLLHQTYESANHVLASQLMNESQRSCKEYLLRKGGQNGRYIFWSANDRDALMKSDHQDIYETWHTLPLAVMKVDLWRLAALYKHGGLYVDMDLVLNNNTPDLFSSNQLVCGTENAEHYCAWLLSAPRGSAAVFHILQHLKAKLKEAQPITAISFADDEHIVHSTTGPGALTSAIKSWLAANGIGSRHKLSPSGASYPGVTVLPRAALRGGLAKHHFMGGKSNGWLEHRDRLVTEGKQIQEEQKHRDLERDRLEEVQLYEQKQRQEKGKQKEKERLEWAQLEEQMQERARIEQERARNEIHKEKDKERLEKERTSNEIQTLRDNVIGHAEDVAKRTKNEIETALTLVAKEVCCNTENVVRQLVRPLDLASATAIENENVLRKVDNKFPDGAGQDIITKLEEMHSTIGTIAAKLEATQLRLESMERTRLLEAEGAVATGILDDDEFVLVYVGPSAVNTVTLAHIRECEEGEYEITPELQVSAGVEEKAVFICRVTALDIVVTRRDGEEGWLSDLRFFLPRPATGVCKYLEDVDDTTEDETLGEMRIPVEEEEAVADQSAAVARQNAVEAEATDERTAGQYTPVKQEEVVKSEGGISAERATTEVVEDTKLAVENEGADRAAASDPADQTGGVRDQEAAEHSEKTVDKENLDGSEEGIESDSTDTLSVEQTEATHLTESTSPPEGKKKNKKKMRKKKKGRR